MPLRPRESDALVARDGLRTLAEGAKLESRPGETRRRGPQATKLRVI
jgi:cold shock CspA family protein